MTFYLSKKNNARLSQVRFRGFVDVLVHVLGEIIDFLTKETRACCRFT